jgi:hypothetical protein
VDPDPVAVSFLYLQTVSLPQSLLLLLSVFVGAVFASVSGFAREIELKHKVRQLEKRIVELSAPVNQTPRVERGPAHRGIIIHEIDDGWLSHYERRRRTCRAMTPTPGQWPGVVLDPTSRGHVTKPERSACY